MKTKLQFAGTVGHQIKRTVYLGGLESLAHAKVVACDMIGSLSIDAGVALYLSSVVMENGDFECGAIPECYREGTFDIDEKDFAISSKAVCPTSPNFENSDIAFLCR
jgi:hypothetical protein